MLTADSADDPSAFAPELEPPPLESIPPKFPKSLSMKYDEDFRELDVTIPVMLPSLMRSIFPAGFPRANKASSSVSNHVAAVWGRGAKKKYVYKIRLGHAYQLKAEQVTSPCGRQHVKVLLGSRAVGLRKNGRDRVVFLFRLSVSILLA